MPSPIILPAVTRFAGDDWAGANAFSVTAWLFPPTYAADGVTTITGGVPLNITGYTPSGALYRRAMLNQLNFDAAVQAPIALTGTVTNATAGLFQLVLERAFTGNVQVQDPDDPVSALVLRAMLTDTAGNLGTIGIVPVFVL